MIAIAATADQHVNNYMALPPADFVLDGGGHYVANKYQAWMRANWEHYWQWVKAETPKGAHRLCLYNGDLCDGIMPAGMNGVDITTINKATMREATVQALQIGADWAEALYVVRGTARHGGDDEETIAKELGAVKDEETGNYSTYELWQQWEGITAHITHHQPVSHVATSAGYPMTKEGIIDQLNAQRWEWPSADLLIRAHAHRYEYRDTAWGQRYLSLPCWEARPAYTYKGRWLLPHIGGVLIIIDGKEIQVQKRIYPLPAPMVKEVQWKRTDRNQDSRSVSGNAMLANFLRNLKSRVTTTFMPTSSPS